MRLTSRVPQDAITSIFFTLTFFEPREGLRRKGGTTRSILTNMHCRQKSITLMEEAKSTSSWKVVLVAKFYYKISLKSHGCNSLKSFQLYFCMYSLFLYLLTF